MNEEETKVEEVKVEEAKAEVTETTNEEAAESKKGMDVVALIKKNLKWIAIAVAALILICIIGSCASGKDRYTRFADRGECFERVEEDQLINLKGVELSTKEDISYIRYSEDYSLTTVLTEDDTLYFVKGEELVKVDEEVNTFVVSAYGDSIAYIKDIENHVGDLYLYNVAKENATKVDSEVYNECITLSPDGKTVAYVGNCEMEYDSWWGYYEVMSGDLYVSKNGKEAEKLYKDAAPIAISDDAKYVYYIGDVSDNAKFYMNDEKIISDSNEGMDLYFNDDLSELLYYTDGETRLFTAAKKTDVKVKNAKLYGVVVPEDVIIGTFMDNVYYVGIDTFDKSVLNLDFSYYFMFDKGEETEKVCSGVSDFVMSEDGKSILYAEDDELLYVKDVTKSREEKVLGEDLEIRHLYTSKDLKKIYYCDSEAELFFFKKGKGVTIAEDVTDVVYSDEFGVIYYVEDEELFYATTSKKSKKSITEDIVDLYSESGYVLYEQEESKDSWATYVMTGKNKAEFLYE